jgi:hypothetical protein
MECQKRSSFWRCDRGSPKNASPKIYLGHMTVILTWIYYVIEWAGIQAISQGKCHGKIHNLFRLQ